MRVFNVTRFRVAALIISLMLIAGFWAYTLFVGEGFNFGIDYRAGLFITAEIPSASDEQDIRDALADYSPDVRTAGSNEGRFNIRIADDESAQDFQRGTSRAVNKALTERFGTVSVLSEDYVGLSFAGSLAVQTIWVTLIALGLIMLYVWIRFKLNYAISAVAAVFHDVLFLLGFIGAFGLEFSTASVAALLTIIGYSLNDTIVIFDRVRENARIVKDTSFREVINLSVSQSLSRTLITSVTTLLAVLAILVFAGGPIRTFALNLAVGVVVGTYSSIFVASPILLAWHDRSVRRTEAALNAGAGDSSPAGPKNILRPQFTAPELVKQTAEEIAEATERRARAKAKKKKKKK